MSRLSLSRRHVSSEVSPALATALSCLAFNLSACVSRSDAVSAVRDSHAAKPGSGNSELGLELSRIDLSRGPDAALLRNDPSSPCDAQHAGILCGASWERYGDKMC